MADASKLSCDSCTQEISPNAEKHICCNWCGKHFHPSCAGLTQTAVKQLLSIRNQIIWLCTNCRSANPYNTIIEKAKKSSDSNRDNFKAIHDALDSFNRRLSIIEEGPERGQQNKISIPISRPKMRAPRGPRLNAPPPFFQPPTQYPAMISPQLVAQPKGFSQQAGEVYYGDPRLEGQRSFHSSSGPPGERSYYEERFAYPHSPMTVSGPPIYTSRGIGLPGMPFYNNY